MAQWILYQCGTELYMLKNTQYKSLHKSVWSQDIWNSEDPESFALFLNLANCKGKESPSAQIYTVMTNFS